MSIAPCVQGIERLTDRELIGSGKTTLGGNEKNKLIDLKTRPCLCLTHRRSIVGLRATVFGFYITLMNQREALFFRLTDQSVGADGRAHVNG